MATPKFRPYLTITQLNYFLDLMQSDDRAATENLRKNTTQELKLFLLKHEYGGVTPAFVSTGRKSIADKLGLDLADPLQAREAAYATWTANPQLCTAEEIKMAQLYRYENNLMSPSEEAEYEQGI